ncbi:hypothetical protein PybrP1_004328 [[Pythium] brassicae (nom. inval.)]|nr:hypothetical protein PybrP1_004328 [[Pythium] brassicae (nom. inval.)]
MEQKYKKRDDASARLGEKMLQGWTLLGATCPMDGCFTPFVRNKQGQMYCVSCEQFAVTEEEARQQREQQEKQREEALAAQLAKEELEREQRIHERFRADEQRNAAEAQQFERTGAASQASSSVKRKSEQVPLGSKPDDDNVNALRRQALAALYQKVEDLTTSLSASDHSERLAAVSKTLRELAETIKTLSSAGNAQ